jgi:hypothetical protein
MICVLLGSTLGVLFPKIIHLAGGFASSGNLNTEFVHASHIGSSFGAIAFGLLHLSGAYPFGLAIGSLVASLALIRGVGLVLMVAAVRRAATQLIRPSGGDPLDRMLCAAILLTLAACVLSGQYGNQVTSDDVWTGGAAVRYLVPTWMLGAVLAARQIPDAMAALPAPRLRLAARVILVLFAVSVLIGGDGLSGKAGGQSDWIKNAAPASVARWLEQRKLKSGVGEYWSAYLITALSGERVRVGPVVPRRGRLVPMLRMADREWYLRPPEFVIWTEKNESGVTTDEVRATYCIRGCKMSSVAQYDIAVLAH